MTQKERQTRSQKLILQAALAEFSQRDYQEITVGEICEKHGISKGMLYHYYSGKDDLFLLCVADTFAHLVDFLKAHLPLTKVGTSGLEQYFVTRQQFFNQFPLYKRIFQNATFHAPPHLKEKISRLRRPLIELNHDIMVRLVANCSLRDRISPEDALRYFESMEELFWSLFERFYSLDDSLDHFESAAKTLLDMILFGIAKQQPEQSN